MTTIQCSAGVDIPADIHIYSPYNDVVLPDDTIAFVVARAFCPPNETAFLDAYHLIPVPGNPTETEYQSQRVPDCPYPFALGVGAVSGTEVLADSVTKAFSVVVSDYVRDGMKSSTVQYDCLHLCAICACSNLWIPLRCCFNSSRPRWSNTPLPIANSCVHFFGTIADVNSSGAVRIDVDNIAINVGPNTNESTSSPSSKVSPVKRRKFNAIAMNVPKSVSLFPFFATYVITFLRSPSSQQNIPSSPTPNAESSSSSLKQVTPSPSQPTPIGGTPLTSPSSSSSGTMVTAPSSTPSAITSPISGTVTLFVLSSLYAI